MLLGVVRYLEFDRKWGFGILRLPFSQNAPVCLISINQVIRGRVFNQFSRASFQGSDLILRVGRSDLYHILGVGHCDHCRSKRTLYFSHMWIYLEIKLS